MSSITITVENTGPFAKNISARDANNGQVQVFFLDENGQYPLTISENTSGYGNVNLSGTYATGQALQPVNFSLLKHGEVIKY